MSHGYLVQGLGKNTLVAGKSTALRLVTAPWPSAGAAAVTAAILRPDGSRITLDWYSNQLTRVAQGTAEEGIVVVIPGSKLPDVGLYYVRATILTALGGVAETYEIDAVGLLPTKDLRMMVHRVWSRTGPAAKPGEVAAAHEALQRLATLYPVRDGISRLNGDMEAGLRYDLVDDPQGPPAQDANLGPSWDPYQTPAPGKDRLDVAVAYRFPDAGEGSGASSQGLYNGWLPWSLIVWSGPFPGVFSHETGHSFGLESPFSPHFDPTGQKAHSKDLTIDPTDAAEGFDVQHSAQFPLPTYDLMYPTGPVPGYPSRSVSLNSWDWEFLRKRLLDLPSTGPHEPYLDWHNLGGHDLREPPAAARNQDGRMEVFVLGGDRALYHIWETSPGGAWHEWRSLEGRDLLGPIPLRQRG